jgi:hypothetical protein
MPRITNKLLKWCAKKGLVVYPFPDEPSENVLYVSEMTQEIIDSRKLLETAHLLLIDFGQLVSGCEVEVSPTVASMYDKWMEKYDFMKANEE